MGLSDEQLEWQRRCRTFAVDVIRPLAAELDRDARFPFEIFGAARDAGLYDSSLLERLAEDPGGLLAAIYAEELHFGCAGVALALGAATAVAATIALQGTPDQYAQWRACCYGDGGQPAVAAYALTEPHAGSDVHSLRTRARPLGKGWVIDGQKTMINNGGIAALTLVVATVEPDLGPAGQATFVIPAGTHGLASSKPMEKLGLRASHTADLFLEDVRVGEESLLGGSERLLRRVERARKRSPAARSGSTTGSPATLAVEVTRPLFGAGAVGIARAGYEWTLAHLETRPVEVQEAAAPLIADLASEIDAARLLVYRASSHARAGVRLSGGEGSMSKLKASRVATWALSAAMDAVGPRAGSNDCPLGKWLRDATAFEVLEGTTQIQRRVIARAQRRRMAAA